MTKDEKTLNELLLAVYERHKTEPVISPSWLATEAMQDLDPDMLADPRLYLAGNLYLRQLARKLLPRKFDPVDDAGEAVQHELWPDLQARYPAVPSQDEEPAYKVLELVTTEDWRWDIHRLRQEAQTKLAHADALEAWGRKRGMVLEREEGA